jgi:hypothetical protein
MEPLPSLTDELVRSTLFMAATLLAIYFIVLLGLNPIGFFVYGLGAIFATHRLFQMVRQHDRPLAQRIVVGVVIAAIWGALLINNFVTRYFVING